MTSKRNIFIGLYEVAGYNGSLKKGFDELGIPADFYPLNDNLFHYNEARTGNPYLRLLTWVGNRNARTPSSRYFAKSFWLALQHIAVFPLFLWSLIVYDTFIFGFGMTFYNLFDLPLLKALDKRVIFVFFGSDARPVYLNGKFALDLTPHQCIRKSRMQKARIKKIEKYACCMINHPPASHFHERPFASFLQMGIPVTLDVPGSSTPGSATTALRILHSPTDPERKGTKQIRSAVRRLRSKGHNIELVEIIDRPNREVIEELSRCDLVIDELYSDSVMARFAAEAAFFGKPVIVGGYAAPSDLGVLSDQEMPPVHHCHPDALEAAIEQLVVDADYRSRLGEQARRFVRDKWSTRAVAGRYLQLINGEYPSSWFCDPRDIRYLHGWGLSEEQARSSIRNIVAAGGKSALQISDKPDLEERFLLFASSAAGRSC